MRIKVFMKDRKIDPFLSFHLIACVSLLLLVPTLAFGIYALFKQKSDAVVLWQASLQPPLNQVECSKVDEFYDRCFHLGNDEHIQHCKERLLPRLLHCYQIERQKWKIQRIGNKVLKCARAKQRCSIGFSLH